MFLQVRSVEIPYSSADRHDRFCARPFALGTSFNDIFTIIDSSLPHGHYARKTAVCSDQ